MTRIVEVTLSSSAGKLDRLPEETLPEVAFAGRSNVGKSSLLNALCQRTGLFKVSQTPGRTRTIVHALARLDDGRRLYVVDLPGYGYAQVAKGAKRAWSELLDSYLRHRTALKACVVLVDIRRGPQDEEWQLLEFLAEQNKQAVLVATKADKVPKSQRKILLDKIVKETGRRVIATSAQTRDGMDDLLKFVASLAVHPAALTGEKGPASPF
ncbi:MAG: ribosome biogenesis GTP-binding protein YihA/YsxC [Myxococcota bacterium]|jgi:GTP-binding protein|nr:ribosome biogenesis GTP-binding protein YihA/YsxC [Myxococcota bacterium]